jgi:hypothetical protein
MLDMADEVVKYLQESGVFGFSVHVSVRFEV